MKKIYNQSNLMCETLEPRTEFFLPFVNNLLKEFSATNFFALLLALTDLNIKKTCLFPLVNTAPKLLVLYSIIFLSLSISIIFNFMNLNIYKLNGNSEVYKQLKFEK